MIKVEFVKWFELNAGFSREGIGDDYWRYMVDYADYRFDYVEISEETVIYRWEELYWGGSELKEKIFTFEDFIEAYKNDCITN
jgi:hypothetical protein